MLVRLTGVDLFVWLHTETQPPDDEWEHALAVMGALKTERGGDVSRVRSLVVSDGAVPNRRQRKSLHEFFGDQPQRISVITVALSNPINRGITAILGWLNPGFRAFRPEEARAAFTHLEIADHTDEIWTTLTAMQAQLRPIEALRLMAAAIDRSIPAGAPVLR
jgi:hypothetical protein